MNLFFSGQLRRFYIRIYMDIGSQANDAMPKLTDVISPNDIVIAVMGTTGAGKSSFIADCTEVRAPRVDRGLFSYTTQVSIHSTRKFGPTVHFLDTPGFNDTSRSDGETFQELAYWLAAASESGIYLSGIVFLHRITDVRFQGSAKRALEVVKAMCGIDAFCGLVIATTMWDKVASSDMGVAKYRQKQLYAKVREDVVAHSIRFSALSAARDDTHRIVKQFLHENRRLRLAIQEELVIRGSLLHETTAGKVMYDNLLGLLDPVRVSTGGSAQEMMATLRSLRATRAELQVTWERRMRQEDEEFEWLARRYRDCWQTENYRSDATTSMLPSMIAEVPSDPIPSQVREGSSIPSNICSSSNTDIESELATLKRQYEAAAFRQRNRLDRRTYLAHGRGTTTLGVVGTGLAVGQLAAAIACNVM